MIRRVLQGVVFLALSITFTLPCFSDTGKYAAQRVEVGNSPNTRRVLCLGSASTALAVSSDTRPDLACINISSFTVYIGSNAAGSSLSSIGFPIFSSGTVSMGAMSGAVYCLSGNAADAEMRCWDGLTQ